jgi:hypothetical protein
VYPDPNTGGCYLKFSRKPSREQKIFRENFRENENFREKFRESENFRETKFREISRKVGEFSLIFAFRENEKRGFRFNPKFPTFVH